MRQLVLPLLVQSVLWTTHLVHGQIVVGCFQNQPDSSTGIDSKSFQDIFMSQGACTNFCKTSGSAYAFTSEGSTCHCSNSPPLDANKVDDSKCDKPCMGYPFEMCGGTTGHGLANILLIGGSAGVPLSSGASTTGSSPSTPSSSLGSDLSNHNDKSIINSDTVNGGKALNSNSPGMLPPHPPGPTTTGMHDFREKKKEREKESGLNTTSTEPVDEEDQSTGSGNTSAGVIAASIMAIFGFGILFAVAVVFSKKRRARLAQAAWTENMLLPSSLIHTSNDDELEGQDYTRATPLYHANANPSGSTTNNPANLHFPPPPILHPRQSEALHMQQPSYPPPLMSAHYNGNMRGPYQQYPMPTPMHPQLLYEQLYEHASFSHKEPLSSSPPPFSRGPQTLHQHPPLEDDEDRLERTMSHPPVTSIRLERRASAQRGSVDSAASGLRVVNPDGSFY